MELTEEGQGLETASEGRDEADLDEELGGEEDEEGYAV